VLCKADSSKIELPVWSFRSATAPLTPETQPVSEPTWDDDFRPTLR
jgi:hypothetical protein